MIQMKKFDVPLRVTGSCLVIVGWVLINHTYTTEGVLVTLLGDILALPWLVRLKSWDMAVMIGVMHGVTIHKLAQGWFTSGS